MVAEEIHLVVVAVESFLHLMIVVQTFLHSAVAIEVEVDFLDLSFQECQKVGVEEAYL